MTMIQEKWRIENFLLTVDLKESKEKSGLLVLPYYKVTLCNKSDKQGSSNDRA